MSLPLKKGVSYAPEIADFELVETSVDREDGCEDGLETVQGSEPGRPDEDASDDHDHPVFGQLSSHFDPAVAMALVGESN